MTIFIVVHIVNLNLIKKQYVYILRIMLRFFSLHFEIILSTDNNLKHGNHKF